MLTVTIDPRGIRALYVLLGTINTALFSAFALILTGQLRPGTTPVPVLDPAHQLNLQAEGGVAAVWYSSALALLVSVVAVVSFWNDRARRQADRGAVLRHGWLLLAAAALFYSLDDTAQLHDGLAIWFGAYQSVLITGLTDASPQYIWVALLGPLILLCGLLLFGFFVYWLAATPRARLLGCLGILCWATVPGLEFVESRLMHTFGPEGAGASWFVEEVLEVTGATLLLFGALEYLIGQGEPQSEAIDPPPARAGRRALFAGVAAPVLLIPLAGLTLVIDPDLRQDAVNAGYYASAWRIVRVMQIEQEQGHNLILSSTCDRAAFERAFPFEMGSGGSLLAYPAADERRLTPPRELNVLALGSEAPAEPVAASLARAVMSSTNTWYLRCGDPPEGDRMVEAWLDRQFPDAERLWLPGFPPIVLTRVAFTPPLPTYDGEYQPIEQGVFGDGEVELIGYDLRLDTLDAEQVLRVTLLWKELREVETDYHVFVHLVGAEDEPITQSDGVPVYDRYPFSTWSPGDVVVDMYDLAVPDHLPFAQVGLVVGLYDFETGERLPVGSSDHLRLK